MFVLFAPKEMFYFCESFLARQWQIHSKKNDKDLSFELHSYLTCFGFWQSEQRKETRMFLDRHHFDIKTDFYGISYNVSKRIKILHWVKSVEELQCALSQVAIFVQFVRSNRCGCVIRCVGWTLTCVLEIWLGKGHKDWIVLYIFSHPSLFALMVGGCVSRALERHALDITHTHILYIFYPVLTYDNNLQFELAKHKRFPCTFGYHWSSFQQRRCICRERLYNL